MPTNELKALSMLNSFIPAEVVGCRHNTLFVNVFETHNMTAKSTKPVFTQEIEHRFECVSRQIKVESPLQSSQHNKSLVYDKSYGKSS